MCKYSKALAEGVQIRIITQLCTLVIQIHIYLHVRWYPKWGAYMVISVRGSSTCMELRGKAKDEKQFQASNFIMSQFMMFQFHSVPSSCCFNFMIFQFRGVPIPWYFNFMILQFHDVSISWDTNFTMFQFHGVSISGRSNFISVMIIPWVLMSIHLSKVYSHPPIPWTCRANLVWQWCEYYISKTTRLLGQ